MYQPEPLPSPAQPPVRYVLRSSRSMKIKKTSVQLWWFATVLTVVSGCAWWHNVSTYFNTIYLARTHLEAYEYSQKAITPPNSNGAIAVLNHRWLDEEYKMRQIALRDGRVLPITPSFSQSLAATKEVNNVHLDSAIILGSKVLADKKGNKFIEDALYIVGKAQFYKNDFNGAERKFLELLYKFPETHYAAEIEVFLARATLVNKHFDTAAMVLNRGMTMTAESNDKAALSAAHRAFAELIYAKNPDSLSGIAEELHKAEDGLSGEELGRLAYEEGAVDFLAGNWTSAKQAFEVSYNNAKDDWLIGEAHIAHALALREQDQFDDARAELKSVVSKAKYGPSQPAARYELAYTDELAARHAVHADLRSPEFRSTYHGPLRAEYYVLDTMYKNSSAVITSRSKFRQAEMYREMGLYDSAARMAASLIGTKDFGSSAMNEYVSQQANSLASFAKWRAELDKIDSTEHKLSEQPVRTKAGGQVRNESAEIHLQAMQEILGNRWQPQQPVQITKEDSIRIAQLETRLRSARNVSIPGADTSRFMDSLNLRKAMAHYQLGRAYETFGEVSEARNEYRTAANLDLGTIDTAKTALRAQTIYAWLNLEQHENNRPMRDSLLHELMTHYGQTIYAEQARALFMVTDQNSPGEVAYRDAYGLLRAYGLDKAKLPLLQVAESYSQEDVAPRALYAVGESYEELSKYDSAVAYYRRVQKEYPYSSYALALRPRLADATPPGLPHASPPPIDPTTIPPGVVPSTPQNIQPGASPQAVPQQPGRPPVRGHFQPGNMPPPQPPVKPGDPPSHVR